VGRSEKNGLTLASSEELIAEEKTVFGVSHCETGDREVQMQVQGPKQRGE
jgi:hypothetical protein